jgi:hypothetical protein
MDGRREFAKEHPSIGTDLVLGGWRTAIVRHHFNWDERAEAEQLGALSHQNGFAQDLPKSQMVQKANSRAVWRLSILFFGCGGWI